MPRVSHERSRNESDATRRLHRTPGSIQHALACLSCCLGAFGIGVSGFSPAAGTHGDRPYSVSAAYSLAALYADHGGLRSGAVSHLARFPRSFRWGGCRRLHRCSLRCGTYTHSPQFFSRPCLHPGFASHHRGHLLCPLVSTTHRGMSVNGTKKRRGIVVISGPEARRKVAGGANGSASDLSTCAT